MSTSELDITLKFLDWQELYSNEKPFQIFIDIPDDAVDQRGSNLVFKDIQVPLKDVRTMPDHFSLDDNGFIYRKHKTNISDLADRETVETIYLPEVESILRKEMEGVDRVFFFDWRLRKNAPNVEGSLLDLNDKAAWLRPATHVHVDQSPAAALNRIQSQLSSDAEFLLKGRVRIVNVWRSLIRSVEDWPLAVCDGATVKKSDLIETDHVRRHYTGSTLYLQHNPEQRFYYMSKQGKDDVLIFKQFDSQRDIPGQFAPHGSFNHPSHAKGVEPRASIEAASGIGKETAFSFAEAGARGVVFADINEEGAIAAAEESKTFAKNVSFKAIAVKVDIIDEASVENMVQTTLKEFGRIDYSVNSAGIANLSGAITPNIKAEMFSRALDTNVRGTMLCVRAVSKAMAAQEPLSYESRRYGTRSLGRGSIVNIGSVSSYVAAPGMMPYTVSKHAIIGITKTAALDLLSSNIRVNTVCPSWVDTPMMQASLQRVPKLGAMIKAMSPLKRAAVPEEVVDYILFLCGPGGSYINGTGLVADAGATLMVHV